MAATTDPVELCAQLLASEDHDNEVVIAETDDFLDENAHGKFDSRFQSVARKFDSVEQQLCAEYGDPVFCGDKGQADFPSWASSGYRVAYWNINARTLYLHITQTDKELPLELTLGVVDEPPAQWFIGFNPFDAG